MLQNRRPRQQPSHDHAWVPIGPWIQPAGLILSAVVGEDPNPQPLPYFVELYDGPLMSESARISKITSSLPGTPLPTRSVCGE